MTNPKLPILNIVPSKYACPPANTMLYFVRRLESNSPQFIPSGAFTAVTVFDAYFSSANSSKPIDFTASRVLVAIV